ncbi:hypothetical protein BaRGS_00030204 [Batillaria attramentaria]|uniref:Arsenite methyltransferase n=1 Tax=Batillaria attramentaria TaxID=370345 RepID=A0ABD0JV35_9CAEN
MPFYFQFIFPRSYYGSGMTIPEKLAGKRVLDIGCGSGSFVFILSKLVGPSGYVVGVDISDGLIETAKSESEYHWKLWGYSKPNFEFHVGNAERLDELGLKAESFDLVVSNGVFCVVPDKDRAFAHAYNLLKTGGQFYLNDVYAEKDPPAKYKDNETLWCMGTTGAMRWDTLAATAVKAGFTVPYLTQVAPINIAKEEYNTMLENGRFLCVGWRLFKLPKGAKRGPSRVTYNGNIPGFPDAFPWDVDLTFKKGVGVDVDSALATILSASYLSDSFAFADASGSPTTKRNQNPFALIDKLKAEGRMPDSIYKVE